MYRRNFPNDPGFADSIAAAAARQRRPRPDPGNRTPDRPSSHLLPVCLLAAALTVAGSCLGFWNEGRAAARDHVLYEGLERVVSLPAAEFHSPEYEGRLVHVSGKLSVTGAWCRDPEFGVARRAYRMKRIVEVYQWIEEFREHQVALPEGGTRTESVPEYRTDWLPHLLDSRRFAEPARHRNPAAMPHAPVEFHSGGASLGAFELTAPFLEAVTVDKPVTSPGQESQLDELAKRGYRWLDGRLYAPGSGEGRRAGRAEVGDVRISWVYGGAEGEAWTAIGRQSGNSLVAYQVDGYEGDGVALFTEGYRSPRQMFARELARSRLELWGLRAAAWALMLLGAAALTGPPALDAAIARVAPPLRPLMALPRVTQCVCLSGCLSLAVTGLAWARYRPWMAAALLAVCAAPLILARYGRPAWDLLLRRMPMAMRNRFAWRWDGLTP